jgi:alkylated DNA repair dioxygenase AlkB
MEAANGAPELIDDAEKNLHLKLYRQYLSHGDAQHWWQTITSNTRWHRVKYGSARFGKACETPCWTAFYGGFPEYSPYAPVPAWLQPLVDRVSAELGAPFNALLLRLYFDGHDEIAWHTDGRTFLGPTPTIGSLSLGASATFEMRRMRNVWPKVNRASDGGNASASSAAAAAAPYDDGIDHETPVRSWELKDGDLLVMQRETQAHWHHRVPKAKSRRPRLNINFRYILPGTPDAERGQATYYKYMRDGDGPVQAGVSYEAILRKSGSLLGFAAAAGATTAAPAPAAAPGPTASEAAPGAAPAAAAIGQRAPAPAHAGPPPAAPSAAVRVAPAPAVAEVEWPCPKCTLLNPPLAPICQLCEHRRHAPPAASHEQRPAEKRPRVASAPAPRAGAGGGQGGGRTLESMWRAPA